MSSSQSISIKADFHNHTVFSHGKGSIEDNVKAAISKGMRAIAISDHGPGHRFYGIKRDSYQKMRRIIDELSDKYPQIQILLGLEANIMNADGELDVDDSLLSECDILLAGYHFGLSPLRMVRDFKYHYSNMLSSKSKKSYERAVELNTRSMVNAMNRYDIFALTHPGAKGPFDIDVVAPLASQKSVALEINNHHGHLDVGQIRAADAYGCKFLISSDAHRPSHVGVFDAAISRALEAGLDESKIINSSFYYL